MYFHRRGVERKRFDPDPHDPLQLQLVKHTSQYPVFRPPVPPHMDRMPAAKPLPKSPPFTALLRHKQHSVQHLQITQSHLGAQARGSIHIEVLAVTKTDEMPRIARGQSID
jgi:hypothetical protein